MSSTTKLLGHCQQDLKVLSGVHLRRPRNAASAATGSTEGRMTRRLLHGNANWRLRPGRRGSLVIAIRGHGQRPLRIIGTLDSRVPRKLPRSTRRRSRCIGIRSVRSRGRSRAVLAGISEGDVCGWILVKGFGVMLSLCMPTYTYVPHRRRLVHCGIRMQFFFSLHS